MSKTELFKIPDNVIDDMEKRGAPASNWVSYPHKLYVFDGFNASTSQGFKSKTDFVGEALKGDKGAIFEITLWPSTSIDSEDFSIKSKYITNKTNYNQPDTDIVRLIYSQERPMFLINQELDVKDKLIFFTTESIFAEHTNPTPTNEETDAIDPNIAIYVLKSYAPDYDVNGKFINALLTLERLVSFVSARRKEAGITTYEEYDQFKFHKAPVQPINARRRRITFKSAPIVWKTIIKNKNQNVIPNNRVGLDSGLERYQWTEDLFLPIRTDSRVAFSPSWSIERGFLNHLLGNFMTGYIRHGDAAWIEYVSTYEIWPKYTDGLIDLYGSDNIYYAMPGSHAFGRINLHGTIVKSIPYYAEEKMIWGRFLGSQPSANELMDFFFSHSKEILNYIPKFSSTGNKQIIESRGNVNANSLPRTLNQNNSLWFTFKEEALLLTDILFAATQVGAIGAFQGNSYISRVYPGLNNQYTKESMYDVAESLAGDYTPYIGSDKQKDNIDHLLNGNLTWMGETITERPDDFITTSFDFSPHPNDWNLQEMKKYLGIHPSKNRGTLGIDFKVLEDLISKAPREATSSKQIGATGLNPDYMFLRYTNMINLKAYQMQQDFYNNENGEYVLEFEYPENTELTTFDIGYFGGYEMKIEDFQNTYEDAKLHGDKYCEYINHNGIKVPLPPQVYTAANRKGQPNQAYTKIIYGSGQ